MIGPGFVRVASAVPALRVADCPFNVQQIINLLVRAEAEGVSLAVFPELCLTGYTCADLFQQTTLQQGALAALADVAQASTDVYSGVAVVGMPFALDDQLFNCAVVIHRGRVLGVVPKSFIPNYKEFYEGRWFAPAANARSREILLDGETVPFGPDLLFEVVNYPGLVIGVEVCEDLWVPIPPSAAQALGGATVLVNLSASNEVIGKAAYRKQLVVGQSGRCIAAYVYTSCGVWESTTDVVFGGHCLIAENGTLLAESERFRREETLLVTDIDLDRLRVERQRTNSYGDSQMYQASGRAFRRVPFALNLEMKPRPLVRYVDAHPFRPSRTEQLRERCEEIFHTQVAGLAKRLAHLTKDKGEPPVTAIGVSGGLDSTLALLVACKTMNALKASRERITGITMPGFGTTPRTLTNARLLMKELGITAREIDIRRLTLEELRALGHKPFGIDLTGLDETTLGARLQEVPAERRHDLVFENVQARLRTSILMATGFVIGTGDLSELALGWCTYNGDHMSMYNPNSSIPKTLVKFLVEWAANNEFDGEARRVLLDIVATAPMPELLPTDAKGRAVQETESVIGPYELHDFFLFHVLRYGTSPEKVLFLARQAKFDRQYTDEELRKWLGVFIERFFGNQFKRSCLQDGPKVGTVSLSPRGDWRMPSDASAALWLGWLKKS